MADTKITALTAIGANPIIPSTFPIPMVDLTDTSMAASGTTKKVTVNQILGAGGTATLASATITGDLTVDTSTLKVDSANNRVGIGTASPAAELHVVGGANFSDGTTTLRAVSAGNVAYLGTTTTDPLVLRVNNIEQYRIAQLGVFTWSDGAGGTRMTLNSTGLGIGVNPVTSHNLSSAGPIAITGTNSGTRTSYISNSGACSIYYTDGGGSGFFADFGNLIIQPRTSAARNVVIATSSAAGTPVERLVVDPNGNVGIGVTSPSAKLDVQTQTGDCAALVKSNAAGSNATFAIDYVNSYGTHIIKKSGTDVWLSGVIADTGATPNYKIQNGSAVGVQLVSGATAWTTLSDETLKDIIEPISNAVAKVGSLRSVIGKFKTDDASKRRSFLIAQDVKSVLPEAVDVVGENNELGLRYTEVIPLLVAAIKELTARVQTLETR